MKDTVKKDIGTKTKFSGVDLKDFPHFENVFKLILMRIVYTKIHMFNRLV